MSAPADADDGIALYVHWPFCLAKCPYCDFNSHVRAQVDAARFGRALRAELAHEALRIGPRRLASVFFGGGTPSLMPPALVASLLEAACAAFPPDPRRAPEITLEANPTSVEAGRLRRFRDAGINRCSLGVQALDDAALARLGRHHSARDAIDALTLARDTFERISFDLIYARPEQDERAWRDELRTALRLAADHLSLYQLTIEPGTRYATLAASGGLTLPDAEHALRLYEATGEEAAAFGLEPYEVSNYARPGGESRHNLAYWRYADYAGIGPGAHGRTSDGADAISATTRHRSPERWLAAVEHDGHGLAEAVTVGTRDRAREMLLMGLRLAEGIDEKRFARRTGLGIDAATDADILVAAIDEGYLVRRGGRLRATVTGRLLLDALLPRLVV